MFIITKDWLKQHMTDKGGYTAAQGRIFSCYPFTAGWKGRIVGLEISQEEKEGFESAAKVGSKDKVSVLINTIAKLNDDQKRVIRAWIMQNI